MKLNDENCYYYYRTLHQVAKKVNSTLNLADVLNTVVETVSKTLQVKASSIRLLDETQRRLLMSAAYGLSEEYLAKGPVEVDRSGIDKEALEGRPVAIRDAKTDAMFQYPEEAREEGISSVLAVPLSAQNKKIGVLRIYTTEPHEFSADEIEFVAAVAELSAIAIQNARLYQHVAKDYQGLKDFLDAAEGWSWLPK